MTSWLTPEEVARLTKYAKPAKQCGELSRRRIAFIPDRLGYPLVTNQ